MNARSELLNETIQGHSRLFENPLQCAGFQGLVLWDDDRSARKPENEMRARLAVSDKPETL